MVARDVLRAYTGTAQPRPFCLVNGELHIGDGKTWRRRFVCVGKSNPT